MTFDLQFLLILLIIYLSLIAGVFLATISIEELKNHKIVYFLKKILVSIIVFLIIYNMISIKFKIIFALIISIILIKVKFSNQILFGLLPFITYIFKTNQETYILFSSLFVIFGLITATLFCIDFLDKKNDRKLIITKKEIIKKIVKKTNLYLVSTTIIVILNLIVLNL